MKTTVIAVGLLCVLTWSVSAYAATIHVPADQPTIQAGIDAAVDGDTVLVASAGCPVRLRWGLIVRVRVAAP